MDDLLADFIAETRDMLRDCEGELIAWEANPADRGRLDAIFRFVHTVKGNCGFFDFPRLADLSHAAEGALVEVRAGRREPDRALVSAVLAVIDRIADLVDAIEGGTMPPDYDAPLIAALEPAAAESRHDTADTFVSEEPGAALGAGGRSPGSGGGTRTMRLPVELLDRVMSGVSDLVLARNDLARRLRETPAAGALHAPLEQLSAMLTDLRESVAHMRMNRIDNLYQAIPRLVRDLANDLGKQVMIDLEGGDVELDREVIELIRDPVTHLLRNAVDHGLETPAERRAAGKREIGLLTVTARHSGNEVHMVIRDDGRGIDPGRIAARAVRTGHLTEDEAARLDQRARLDLIFTPGLSTAETATAVSGRGVGMDVVRANIEQLGGTVSIETEPGAGTAFHLHLPLTLSIIAGLTVRAGGQSYAIPQSYVAEIARSRTAVVETSRMGGHRLVQLRDKRMAYLPLAELLGQDGHDGGTDERTAPVLVVVKAGHNELFALGVDAVEDYEDLVVKPLAPCLMQGVFAGSTLQNDGRPVLMLDMRRVAARQGLVGRSAAHAETQSPDDKAGSKQAGLPAMLFVDAAGRTGAIRLEHLRRVDLLPPAAIEAAGNGQLAVIDGRLVSLIGQVPEAASRGGVPALRIGHAADGPAEEAGAQDCVLYAVTQVLGSELLCGAPIASDEPGVQGIYLHDGRPVRLLDTAALLRQHLPAADRSWAARAAEPPACWLAAGEWGAGMLAPLLRQAGYRIAASPMEADIEITLEPPTDTAAMPGEDKPVSARLFARRLGAGAPATALLPGDPDQLIAAIARLARKVQP